MSKQITWVVVTLVALTAIAGGAMAIANSDSEGGAVGPQADRAVRAALEATGGGTAIAVERDSEDGATWEVEVTKPNGKSVDVRLDENYDVITIESDDDSEGEDDDDDD